MLASNRGQQHERIGGVHVGLVKISGVASGCHLSCYHCYSHSLKAVNSQTSSKCSALTTLLKVMVPFVVASVNCSGMRSGDTGEILPVQGRNSLATFRVNILKTSTAVEAVLHQM